MLGLLGHLDLFDYSQAPQDQLVNFQSFDSGAADCQPADGHRTDRQGAQCNRTQSEAADAHGSKRTGAHIGNFARIVPASIVLDSLAGSLADT